MLGRVLVLVAVTLLSGAAPGATVETPRVEWSGTVLDARSGAPVAGARVADSEGEEVLTDEGGAFRIEASPGTRLRLDSPRHLPAYVQLQDMEALGDLWLEPATTLTGRVVRAGDPQAGRAVHLFDNLSGEQSTIRTAADGSFEFRRLAIGRFADVDLTIEGVGWVHRLWRLPRRTFDLGDIETEPQRSLRGRVLSSDGAPIARAEIFVQPMGLGGDLGPLERDRWLRVVTEQDGTFRMGLQKGVYALVALGPDGAHALRGAVDIETTPDLDLGEIRLAPLLATAGRVVDAGGSPVAGANVEVGMQAIWAPGISVDIVPQATTRTDTRGCYRLGGIPEGAQFQIDVTADGYRREWRMTPPLAPSPACPVEPTIELSPGVRVSGVVRDRTGERPPDPVWVVARGDADGAGERRLWLDETGSFEDILAPGRWRFFAVAGTGRSREVELSLEGAPVTVDFEVAPTVAPERLVAATIRILRADGRPASGAEVRVDTSGAAHAAPDFYRVLTTGADGRVHLDDLPGGAYAIQASHFDQSMGWEAATPIESTGAELEFRLEQRLGERRRTTGFVTDEAGRPLSGVKVETMNASEPGRVAWMDRTSTDAAGRYEMELPAGGYRLVASRSDRGAVERPQIVNPGSDPPEVVFSLGPGTRVRAEVTGVRWDLLREPRLRIRRERDGGWIAPHWLADDGTYVFTHLGPGRWIAEATASGTAHREVAFEVPAGVRDQEIALRFPSVRTHTITGTLRYRGAPVVGGSVGPWGAHAVTDEDGDFELELPAGTHPLWVSVPSFQSPVVIEDFVLEEDRVVELEIHGARIEGAIVDATTGRPIPDASVRVDPEQNLGADTFQDFPPVSLDGRFGVGPMAAGQWTVEASAPGYTGLVERIVVADEPVEVRLALHPTAGLRARLLGSDGQPLESATVNWQSLDGQRHQSAWIYLAGLPELHWESAPMGQGILTIHTAGWQAIRVPIDNQGQLFELQLGRAGRLEVTVADPEAAGIGSDARLRLLTPDGTPLRAWGVGRYDSSARFSQRERTFELSAVVAGSYRVLVIATDRRWEGEVVIRPGEVTRVVLGEDLREVSGAP